MRSVPPDVNPNHAAAPVTRASMPSTLLIGSS